MNLLSQSTFQLYKWNNRPWADAKLTTFQNTTPLASDTQSLGDKTSFLIVLRLHFKERYFIRGEMTGDCLPVKWFCVKGSKAADEQFSFKTKSEISVQRFFRFFKIIDDQSPRRLLGLQP